VPNWDDVAAAFGMLAFFAIMLGLACSFCDYMDEQGHDRYRDTWR
jgi:hypothetical protein